MTDYLIVGQGLAGSIIAYELQKRKKKIIVVDDHHRSSSSAVAAGMFHALSFRKPSLSWMADELVPYARDFYPKLEEYLGVKLLYNHEVHRVFASADERKAWQSHRNDLAPFVGSEKLEEVHPQVLSPEGGGQVLAGGRIDLVQLLKAMRD